MKNRIAAATLAAIAACATHAQTVDPKDTWNLAEIYPTVQAWNADNDKLTAQLADLNKCAGQMGASATRFKQCMELSTDMDKRMARVYAYASEKYSDDTSLPANLELNQRAELLNNKLNESEAFMRPESLKVGRERIEAFLKQEPTLGIYRHPLDDILRTAEHTLDKEGEELVARFGLVTGTGNTVYTTMTNSDMPWPKVKLST